MRLKEKRNRAYLALTQLKISCLVCETGRITAPTKPNDYNASVRVRFINSGHSPAREIEQNVTTYMQEIDEFFTFPESTNVEPMPKHTFAQASSEFPLEIGKGMRAEDILLAQGKVPVQIGHGPQGYYPLPLNVYGHVSYTDVFGERHTLLYCARYVPPSTSNPEGWYTCREHNEEYDGAYNPPKQK